jgi:hypothetical protein
MVLARKYLSLFDGAMRAAAQPTRPSCPLRFELHKQCPEQGQFHPGGAFISEKRIHFSDI